MQGTPEKLPWVHIICEDATATTHFFGMNSCAEGDLWLLSADNNSSVLDAVNESFHVQDAIVHHRVYICTPARCVEGGGARVGKMNGQRPPRGRVGAGQPVQSSAVQCSKQ